MLLSSRAALFALGLALTGLAVACSGAADSPPSSGTGEIVTPTTGLSIRAQVASVSLSDSSAGVQLAFFAGEAKAAASVQVKGVVLLDAASREEIATLTATAPTVWNGSAYVPWNEQVTPGGDLKASYTLSVPSWGERSADSYATPYRLRVTLLVDGAELVLESEDVQREAPMVT